MKEKAAAIVGIIFAIAVVVFTALKILPLEVFCSLATGAIVWLFKDREKVDEVKRMVEYHKKERA